MEIIHAARHTNHSKLTCILQDPRLSWVLLKCWIPPLGGFQLCVASNLSTRMRASCLRCSNFLWISIQAFDTSWSCKFHQNWPLSSSSLRNICFCNSHNSAETNAQRRCMNELVSPMLGYCTVRRSGDKHTRQRMSDQSKYENKPKWQKKPEQATRFCLFQTSELSWIKNK